MEISLTIDKTLHEYYIVEREEQINFIHAFGINATDYDYDKYLRDIDKEPMLHQTETPAGKRPDQRALGGEGTR